jgi:hypothetical protein
MNICTLYTFISATLALAAIAPNTFANPVVSPSFSVECTVLGPTGKPLPGAEITVIEPNQYTYLALAADTLGHVQLNPKNSDIGDTIIARSGNLATAGPVLFTGQSKLNVTLVSGILCTVQGNVIDQDGNPLPNVTVTLSSTVSPPSGANRVQTDTQGQFTFPPNFPGYWYDVRVDAPGYTTGNSSTAGSAPGQNIQLDPIRLQAANNYAGGTLIDAQGKPMANVAIHDTDNTSLHTTTDPSGHFQLKGVPANNTNIVVSLPDNLYFTQSISSGNNNNIVHVVTPLIGLVQSPDGKPVPGAEIIDIQPNSAYTTISDAAGHFVVTPRPQPGSTIISRKGDLSTTVSYTYNAEDKVTLNLTKGGLCTIKGQVKNPDGSPIANANVALYLSKQGSLIGFDQVISDAQGQYTLSDIYGNQTYKVSANAPGCANASTDPAEVATGQTIQFPTLVLQPADSFVGGTVVDSTGNPVANAVVRAGNNYNQPVTTDKAGHFMLKNVPRDKTTVLATGPDGSFAGTQLPSGRGDNILYLQKSVNLK